mgnify:CR=1 FL=1
MATKQVIISNIKFNLSTEPLVNDPEVYPDYPSVPVNQIPIRLSLILLITYQPIPGTNTYISNDQFD